MDCAPGAAELTVTVASFARLTARMGMNVANGSVAWNCAVFPPATGSGNDGTLNLTASTNASGGSAKICNLRPASVPGSSFCHAPPARNETSPPS